METQNYIKKHEILGLTDIFYRPSLGQFLKTKWKQLLSLPSFIKFKKKIYIFATEPTHIETFCFKLKAKKDCSALHLGKLKYKTWTFSLKFKLKFWKSMHRATIADVKEKYCRFPNHNTVMIHRKKRFTSFPSPAGMSLTKLPLGRNILVMTPLFPPRVRNLRGF